MKIKLAVIFGGCSVEHEISIITAIQAMNNIDTKRYDIIPIYIDKKGIWYSGAMLRDIKIFNDLDLLKRYAKEVVLYKRDNEYVLQSKRGLLRRDVTTVDLVLPIMHGTKGEDGTLQGFLETVGIPYCESDTAASVVGQDKVFMKQIWEAVGVPVVKYDWFFDVDYNKNPDKIVERLEKMGYPLIVKPAHLGSSVGIAIAHNNKELNEAITDAISYDTKILVEEVVVNLKELNISVLGNYQKQHLSVIEEVGGKDNFLSYDDKYKGGGKDGKGMASAKRIIPAKIDETIEKNVCDIAIKAFRALNSSGVVRIDFLVDMDNNKVYANEINSISGSLSFYLWNKTDKEYQELLEDILNIGIRDYKNKQSKTYSFDTNILSSFDGKKGVKGIKK